METRTRYNYTCNALGQRVTSKQSGDVFPGSGNFNGSTYYRYNYNDRGEVTEVENYYGENPAATDSPQMLGRRFSWNFDNAGNRTWSVPLDPTLPPAPFL